MEEKLNQITIGQAVVAGIVVAAIYFFVAYDSGEIQETQILTFQAELTKKQKELKSIERTIAEAGRLKQIAEKSGIQLEKILNYIPEDLNPNSIMKLLSNEAKASGVDIADLSAGKPTSTKYEFIQEIEVNIRLKGTFAQLMTFLSYLTAAGKVITVKELSLTKSSQGEEGVAPQLSFTASFGAFKYVPKKKDG